jgi:hypothetical protein
VSMSSELFANLGQELRTRFSQLNRLPSSCEASYSQLKDNVYRIIKAECETTANFDLDTFNKDFEESFQKRMEDGRHSLSQSNRNEEEGTAKDGLAKRSNKDVEDAGIALARFWVPACSSFPLRSWESGLSIFKRIVRGPPQPGHEGDVHIQADSQRRHTSPTSDLKPHTIPTTH